MDGPAPHAPHPTERVRSDDLARRFAGPHLTLTLREGPPWVRGLGFFELFSVPGTLIHLRRWAFQDVLLVQADGPEPPAGVAESAMRVSFACVLSELDPIATSCNAVLPDSAGAPYDTPWTTRDLEVVTPEQVRVVFTAARQVDRDSAEARDLAALGIAAPEGQDDDGVHDR